jgi:SAM-dependent methyltransferase
MNYEEIFHARGGAYHEAMQRWPDARREEFALPLEWGAPRPGEVVLDVPAGGGYLRRYLPAACRYLGHEPCASFADADSIGDRDLLPLPWGGASADLAFSIAGVHHLEDKQPLYRELHRVLKPGGRLVLADAHVASGVARFLDDFVGRYNSTGHSGIYLDDRTAAEVAASGFSILRSERVHYAWWFPDRRTMGAFARLLFDVRRASVDDVVEAIERKLGTVERGGEVGMRWELLFLLASRNV